MWLQFEVARSPVGVNSGPVGGSLAPNPSQLDPKQSQPDHGQPQIAATRVVAKSRDLRTKGLGANETIQATLCNGSKQHGEYDKTLPLSDLWMWQQLMCPIKAIRRIRPKSCQWAIYGCGCNSCGCSLRSSEVRSGSIRGRSGALWPQNRLSWSPNISQPDHGQPQIAATRIVAKSIDRRTWV